MSRMQIAGTSERPDLRRYQAVCMSCEHWQVDVRAGAISDLGGWMPAMKAVARAHSEHVFNECPNAGGRIKFEGKWVERPTMKSGNEPTGVLALQPFPRWWVTK